MKVADWLLRIAVAFAFLYPPLNALSDPASWLGYFPSFVRDAATQAGIPDMVLLHGFGVVEVIIALWILSGWKVVWPATAAALMLAVIIVLDFGNFQVLFRDVSIMFAAAALAFMHSKSQVTYTHV